MLITLLSQVEELLLSLTEFDMTGTRYTFFILNQVRVYASQNIYGYMPPTAGGLAGAGGPGRGQMGRAPLLLHCPKNPILGFSHVTSKER